MTTFLDGPAKGKTLCLKQSPQFLRVVSAGGKWDALDQWEDTPRPEEQVHVYELAERVGSCHVRMAGGRGGFYTIATYREYPTQPDEAITRDNGVWAEWCKEQKA